MALNTCWPTNPQVLFNCVSSLNRTTRNCFWAIEGDGYCAERAVDGRAAALSADDRHRQGWVRWRVRTLLSLDCADRVVQSGLDAVSGIIPPPDIGCCCSTPDQRMRSMDSHLLVAASVDSCQTCHLQSRSAAGGGQLAVGGRAAGSGRQCVLHPAGAATCKRQMVTHS